MRNGDVADTIKLLARRAELLRSLRPEPQSKRDLVEAMSVSRSTVGRAVRQLEAHGFVERRDGTISISLQGRLALDAYESLTTDVASLDDAGAVLDPLDSTATMEVPLLRNARIVQADSVTPHRPTDVLLEHLQDASRIRGFTTGVLPSHVDIFRERIVEHGAAVEVVVTEDVLAEVVTSHREMLEEVLATDNFDIWCANRTLEYSLLVVENGERTVVCALVYDERGVFGVVENDDERAVNWAADVLEVLREDAEPIPL